MVIGVWLLDKINRLLHGEKWRVEDANKHVEASIKLMEHADDVLAVARSEQRRIDSRITMLEKSSERSNTGHR